MKKFGLLFLLSILFSTTALADEGMWMLNQIKDLDLDKKGLEIKPEDLYSPGTTSILDAIVWLGGCSASFVSDQGLVLTNHHCGYGALQRNASISGIDYIKEGFLAKDKSEELPAMGSYAYVIQDVKDVSKEVLAVAKDEEDLVERDKLFEAKIAEMVEALEQDRDDISVRVVPVFKGKQYWQFVYKKYQDVRIVYAPPSSIGKYGGDIDNWMWPRHTGDFTFLRVYQGPDGSGAKFSTENVPVQPKNYLKIAQEPLKEGDFSYILGFPGKTTRWHSSYSVTWSLEHKFKSRIKEFSEVLDIMDEFGAENPQAKIKLAGFHSGLANAMKNYQGNVDGMERNHFIDQKQKFEAELINFINEDSQRKENCGNLFSDIKQEFTALEKVNAYQSAVSNFDFLGGTLSSLGSQIYGIVREREKPEGEREPGFSERKTRQNAERLKFRFLSFYEPFDRVMFARALKKAKAQNINALDYIKDIDAFVESAYNETKLKNAEFAKELFFKSVAEIDALNDPFLKLAAALYNDKEQIKKDGEARSARMKALRRQYIQAVQAYQSKEIYPDANGTIRFTYGYIKGYQPQDAVEYAPFTTLSGVVSKDTGEEPFDMPAKLGELFIEKDFSRWQDKALGDVPVAFLNTCDITGGNSGSAVMNAKGELTGLAFDGNYEAMTSDWQFDENIQRTIAVDIRYVMFVTEKFAGAKYLLKEMGL